MRRCLEGTHLESNFINAKRKIHIPLQRELAQVNLVLRSSDQIHKLTHLSLIGRLMEQVEQISVIRLRAEVDLEQPVNSSFEHERVVDSDMADFGDAVPAWLAAPGDGLVHHVVGDEEVCLELGNKILMEWWGIEWG